MFKSRFLAVFMSMVLALGMCPLLAFASTGSDEPAGSKLVVAAVDDEDEDVDADEDEEGYEDEDEDADEDGDEDFDEDEGEEEGDEDFDEDEGEEEGDEDFEEGEDDFEFPSLEDAVVTGIAGWTYDGKSHITSVEVVLDGETLKEGVDYDLYFEDEDAEEIDAANIVNAGEYTAYIEGLDDYDGDLIDIDFTVKQAANPLKASAKARTAFLTAKALKKKPATVNNVKIQNAKGAVKCKNLSKNKTAKKFKVNATKSTVTVPPKTKAGKYPVVVQVRAEGNDNYLPSKNLTVSFTIQVKK